MWEHFADRDPQIPSQLRAPQQAIGLSEYNTHIRTPGLIVDLPVFPLYAFGRASPLNARRLRTRGTLKSGRQLNILLRLNLTLWFGIVQVTLRLNINFNSCLECKRAE